MSVGDFINDSMLLLGHKRYESAMCLAMNALDVTASREYPVLAGPGKVGERCMRFVRDHYDIVTSVGTGGAIYSAPGSHLNLPDPKTGTTNSLEGILYHTVRCLLTHETALPGDTFFNEQAVYGQTPQGFSIPAAMVYAVILAVVGANTNTGETSNADIGLIVRDQKIPIAECWGRKEKILSLLGMPVGPKNGT
jgi:hypothetical protein